MTRPLPPRPLTALNSALGLALLASVATPQSGIVSRGALILDSSWNSDSFVEVSAGRYNTLALRTDGSVVAWGENSGLESEVPALPAGTTYLEVATGGSWVCPFDCIYYPISAGLRSDGSVAVWGGAFGSSGYVPALPSGVDYVGIAAETHLLAVRSDGELAAWGDNASGQTDVPALSSGLAYVEADAGQAFSLARRSDGSVVGWGLNTSGQCDAPALPAGVDYVGVAAGWAHSLGLRSDGSIEVWGSNNWGQKDVPPLPTGTTYVDVSAGWYHNLAVRSDGEIVAWGNNGSGQCDVPPPPSGRAYVHASASSTTSFGVLDDGTVVGWGQGDRGQLNVPELPAGVEYSRLASGGATPNPGSLGFEHHTLALRSDGTVDAWGYNVHGQCNVPSLPAGVSFVELGAGWGYSAGLRSDGSFMRWGLPYGIPAMITAPPSLPFVELAVGAQHCLRRNSTGFVSASGQNYWGQCNVPGAGAGLSYVEISAGTGHSVARRSDGSVVAWGLNDSGQCDVPPPPAGLSYVEISAGWYFTLARLSDGSVAAFGSNSHGQCDVPAAPAGLTYARIEAGAYHGTGQLSDGSIVVWGDASKGQGSLPPAPLGQVHAGLSAGPVVSAALLQNGAKGVRYCTAGANSLGCAATIEADGDVSIATGQLTLGATCVPSGFALFFHGAAQTQVPFGDGALCVQGNVVRILPAGVASNGQVQTTVALQAAGITTAGPRNFQCWFRDPAAGGTGFNLSDALAITFLP